MGSLTNHRGEKINDDHDGDADILCTFQQFHDTVQRIPSVLLEVATIAQAEKMRTTTGNTQTLN